MILISLLQRVLAFFIDLIIVYLPSLLLTSIIFGKSDFLSSSNILALILFTLYNIISESSYGGKTLGKNFARMKLKDKMGALELSQREVAKMLYFTPFIGPLFILLSIILYLKTKKFLHDIIGKSEVVMDGV